MISLTEAGKRTGIVDLTQGELSTRGNLQLRKKETDAAGKVLKISYRENLNIQDGNIEIDQINKKKIISVIRRLRPEIVFAPYPFDRHPDHINAGNLIRESVFYSGLNKIKTGKLSSFRPKKIFYYKSAYDIPVSFIFDISNSYDKKIECLKCYSSQFYNTQNKEPETFISTKLFEREIETRARYFGFKIGVEFGEPYFSYDAIRVEDRTLFKI